jgi:hypothetical protein
MVSVYPRRALCVACGARRTNLYPAGCNPFQGPSCALRGRGLQGRWDHSLPRRSEFVPSPFRALLVRASSDTTLHELQTRQITSSLHEKRREAAARLLLKLQLSILFAMFDERSVPPNASWRRRDLMPTPFGAWPLHRSPMTVRRATLRRRPQ